MTVAALDHCAIRTAKLEESRMFYAEVLGLKVGPRPALPVPGYWLYAQDRPVVHLIAVGPQFAQDVFGTALDTAACQDGAMGVDHLAFRMQGLAAMRVRLETHGLAYRELGIPELRMHQVFVRDPNGVTAELNFFLDQEDQDATAA